MFSPPQLKTIVAVLAAMMTMTSLCEAQQAEFNRRIAAMQQARLRAQANMNGQANPITDPNVRAASADEDFDYADPPVPTATRHIAQAPTAPRRSANNRTFGSGIVQQPTGRGRYQNQLPANQIASRNQGRPTRMAQLSESSVIEGGSPIMSQSMAPSMGTYETVVDGGYVEGGYVEGGGCDTCGDSYFGACDDCCGRGGCPPGPCWLSGFGSVLYNGEYFAGANGFQNGLFPDPTSTAGNLLGDCSFGFYEGFNFGIPLCRLSCGLLSGQFGLRATQTNFNGNEFTPADRNQIFLTTGVYRRVDYGFQMGVVADILFDDWFTTENSETVQIRSDLGWVFPNGGAFGFRWATNVQDDNQPGTINGINFANINISTEDSYQFYCRREGCGGGFGEGAIGWTDSEQTVFSFNSDVPIRETVSGQAGFAYYLDGNQVPANSGRAGGNLRDAWNIYVGVAWHPRGRSFYRSYDRPLFGVADNGTMLTTRQ